MSQDSLFRIFAQTKAFRARKPPLHFQEMSENQNWTSDPASITTMNISISRPRASFRTLLPSRSVHTLHNASSSPASSAIPGPRRNPPQVRFQPPNGLRPHRVHKLPPYLHESLVLVPQLVLDDEAYPHLFKILHIVVPMFEADNVTQTILDRSFCHDMR